MAYLCPKCGCPLSAVKLTDGIKSFDAYSLFECKECGIEYNEFALTKENSDLCPDCPGKDTCGLERPEFGCKNLATEKAKKKQDNLSPAHYSRWKIEPLEFISENKLDFLRGNIIKYIMRYDMKNGLEDLQKAKVYLEKLIEKTSHDDEKTNHI